MDDEFKFKVVFYAAVLVVAEVVRVLTSWFRS